MSEQDREQVAILSKLDEELIAKLSAGDIRLVRSAWLLQPSVTKMRKRQELETIEGMAAADHLHPLQQKFLESAALQCGICTPGMLIAAKSLLERNPDPTETEVRFWLAGNLCRCTGYDKIVHAVMDVAAEMRGA